MRRDVNESFHPKETASEVDLAAPVWASNLWLWLTPSLYRKRVGTSINSVLRRILRDGESEIKEKSCRRMFGL
jgi:hypothetical protein